MLSLGVVEDKKMTIYYHQLIPDFFPVGGGGNRRLLNIAPTMTETFKSLNVHLRSLGLEIKTIHLAEPIAGGNLNHKVLYHGLINTVRMCKFWFVD